MDRRVMLRTAAYDLVFDAQGRATCVILARNGGDRAVRVQPTIVPLDNAKRAWATLKDATERDLAPGEETQFAVEIAKPPARWSFGRGAQHAFRVALLDQEDATLRDETGVITVRTRRPQPFWWIVPAILVTVVFFQIWHFAIVKERIGVTSAMTYASIETELELDGAAADQLADVRMIVVESPSRATSGRGIPGRSPSPAPNVPDLQTNRVLLVPLNGATIGRSSSFFGIRTCRGGLKAEPIDLTSVCVRTTRGQIVELQIVQTSDRIRYSTAANGGTTTQIDTLGADFARKVYWRWLYWR